MGILSLHQNQKNRDICLILFFFISIFLVNATQEFIQSKLILIAIVVLTIFQPIHSMASFRCPTHMESNGLSYKINISNNQFSLYYEYVLLFLFSICYHFYCFMLLEKESFTFHTDNEIKEG